IISPWTMPFSPWTTNAHDFLANTYYGVAPFAVASNLRVKLRLRPIARPDPSTSHDGRDDRLRAAVAAGRAIFALEARRTLTPIWYPLARVVLEREIAIDQAA